MTNPRRAADIVLDDLGITTSEELKYLEEIAWTRNVMVQHHPLQGAEARLAVLGSQGIITVSTSINYIPRKRFSIAHELGHFELHRYRGLLSCMAEDIYNPPVQQIRHPLEQQANEFAAHLLLPDRFLKVLCEKEEPSIHLIQNLANVFNTSLTATAWRYTQVCEDPIAVVLSRDNMVRWYQASKSFLDMELTVEVNCRLDSRCLASLHFKNREIPRRGRSVQANAWLDLGPYRRDAYIFEQSLAMTSFNAVLTLLWVDDDIEPEDWDDY